MDGSKTLYAFEREWMDAVKAFLIFSVLCAHTVAPMAYGGSVEGSVVAVMSQWGTVGVVGFFILSGYLFSKCTDRFGKFLKKRVQSILIPWLFCGSLVYFVGQVGGTQQAPLSFWSYVGFLVGKNTYLYYLTVLCISYGLFFWIKNRQCWIVVMMLITPVSVGITAMGVFGNLINPYLNPFNWLGFFAIGRMISTPKRLLSLVEVARKWRIWLCILWSVLVMLSILMSDHSRGYFGFFSIPIELTGVLAVFGIVADFKSPIMSQDDRILQVNRVFQGLGKASFSIYLLHMPVAGWINLLFFRIAQGVIPLFKPFLVMVFMMLGLQSMRYIFKKCSLDKFYKIITGMRD